MQDLFVQRWKPLLRESGLIGFFSSFFSTCDIHHKDFVPAESLFALVPIQTHKSNICCYKKDNLHTKMFFLLPFGTATKPTVGKTSCESNDGLPTVGEVGDLCAEQLWSHC